MLLLLSKVSKAAAKVSKGTARPCTCPAAAAVVVKADFECRELLLLCCTIPACFTRFFQCKGLLGLGLDASTCNPFENTRVLWQNNC
jgi:hypothetical protein